MQGNDIRQVEPMIEAALAKMNNHEISAALEILLQAVEVEPENVKIINLIASCYFTKGDFDRAKACWEMVLRLDEANKYAQSRLEMITAPAFQFWLKRYHETLALMESRNFPQAITAIRKLMAENDNFVCLYELLGLCYLAVSDVENARRVWKKGLQLDRSNNSIRGYLEDRKSSQFLAREQHITSNKEMAANKNNKRGFRYHGLAWTAAGVLVLGLLIPAGYYINQRQGLSLQTPVIQKKIMNLNQDINKEKDTKEAAPALSVNLSANAAGKSKEQSNNKVVKVLEDEQLHYDRGLAAYRKEDWKQASVSWKKVVELKSGSYINREALYYLARTYYLMGDLNQAKKYYLSYIEEFPDSNYYDDSLYYLGLVNHRSGNGEAAREFLDELKKYEPNSGYLSSAFYKKIMGE